MQFDYILSSLHLVTWKHQVRSAQESAFDVEIKNLVTGPWKRATHATNSSRKPTRGKNLLWLKTGKESNAIVLDVDVKDSGMETFAEMTEGAGGSSESMEFTQSGTGGTHCFFSYERSVGGDRGFVLHSTRNK